MKVQALPVRRRSASSFLADVQDLFEIQNTVLATSTLKPNNASDKFVHSLFEKQALATPEAVAVQFEQDISLTYLELNEAANRVARQFAFGSSSIIPICMHRSIDMIISLLAIMKAGSAYVVMSPESPAERNRFIVDDTKAPFVLVSEETRGTSGATNEIPIESLLMGFNEATEHQNFALNLHRAQLPSDPAYVIYTSGTTGRPKGVVLSHLAASTGLAALPLPGDSQKPKLLLCYSPVFSAAQRTILGTLVRGGTLCLAGKDMVTSGLLDTIKQFGLENLEITPSMLQLIDPNEVPSSVKRIILGGETAGPAVVDAWADKVELFSSYGLSECTQLSMRSQITKGRARPVIGKPADSTTFHVLSPETLSPVPINAPGELCLSGPQVADGYLNLPEKTKEVFLPNPFGAGRLYRTGDIVKMTQDGTLELLGRIDYQVKIDGQRVEPDESNSLIQIHPGVTKSAVVPATINGRKALVAIIVSDQTKEWVDLIHDIRQILRGEIHLYGIPQFWVELDDLSVNINGKTDMAGLIRQVEAMEDSQLVAPSTRHAKPGKECHICPQITDIIADVLRIAPEAINPEASFLELGGSSLNAIVLASKVRSLGLQISVSDLLQDGPVRKVFEEVTATTVARPPEPFSLLLPGSLSQEEQAELEDAYPVTPLQEGILADSALGNAEYVYQRVYEIQGKSSARVRSVLNYVVQKSPILRTTFRPWKRSFIQLVHRDVTVPWQAMRRADLQATLEQLEKRPMGMDGPLVRATVLDSLYLILEMHHSLFDFWSSQFAFADMDTLLRGGELEHRAPFNTYVSYQQILSQGPLVDTYWQKHLQNAPETVLQILNSGKAGKMVVSKDLGETLVNYCVSSGVSIGTAVHQAWAITLAQHLSTDDVMYLTAFSGRDAEVDGVLSLDGPTLCTVPLRVQFGKAAATPAPAHAKALQKRMWAASKFAPYGLRNVLTATGIRPESVNTMVNVLGKIEGFDRNQHLLPVITHGDNFTQYITLEVSESSPTTVKLLVPFAAEPDSAEGVLDTFVQTIKKMATDPETTVEGLINGQGTKDSNVDSPNEEQFRLAHAAFEQYAASESSRIAIRTKDCDITYGEFNTRANEFAHYLIQGGVKHGDMIPLYTEKSAQTLISIFGILKAGAAYVPLDSRNPYERNKFILSDISADRIITDEENMHSCASFGLPMTLAGGIPLTEESRSNMAPVVHGLSPESTAYVIYTSGSTGMPKGVLVPHSAVDAATQGMVEATRVTSNWISLWVLNYIFDASYYDIFTIFSTGACLCVAPQDEVLSDLAGHINSMGVKQVMLTPTITKLIRGGPSELPGLQVLSVCGEKIDTNILEWAKYVDVYNGYGPTEATILMTVSKVEPEGELASIGYPLRHASAMIIPAEGDSLGPVVDGEVGELCILGPQLAKGYLGRPEQTAKVFIQNSNGQPLYRTGDLARWAEDGSLHCFGRKDFQLGEIESSISLTGRVAAVVVSVAQVIEKPQLVAFCIFEGDQKASTHKPLPAGERRESVQELMENLTSIAHYMMPSVFFSFHSFPTLPSGKTNHKELVNIVEGMTKEQIFPHLAAAGPQIEFVPATTEEEIAMQEAWSAVLSVPTASVGATTDFLAVGGDSIAAINVVAECRRLGFEASVGQILAKSTLGDQASCLKPTAAVVSENLEPIKYSIPQSVTTAIKRAGLSDRDIEDIYPCGPGQIEFLTQGNKEHQFWNLTAYRSVPDDFDMNRWKEVTRKLTIRNEILRAMFYHADAADPSSWYQIVLREPVMNWDEVEYATEAEMTNHVQALRKRPFEFGTPNVEYLLLTSTLDGSRILAIKLDHGTYDGTLLRIFDEQFTAITRGDSKIPEPEPFKNFIDRIYAADTDEDLEFWSSELETYEPKHTLPRKPVTDHIKFAPLSSDIDIDALATKLGVTPSTIFQVAYAIVTGKLTGTSDVLIDHLITGRNVAVARPQLLNGACANFLPSRTILDPSTPVSSFLKDAQAAFWASTEHGSVGLHDIYQALGQDRDEYSAKMLFCFQPFDPVPTGTKVNHMRWVVLAQSKIFMTINYALMVEVQRTLTGYRLKLQWDSHAFVGETIDGVVTMFDAVFAKMKANTAAQIGTF